MPEMSPAPPPDRDHRDPHHRRVMAIAIVAVLLLLGAMVWVVQLFIAQQKLERCLASGRRDCLRIEAPLRNNGPEDRSGEQR
jgi:hypothetical protein